MNLTHRITIFVGFCGTEMPDYIRTVLGDGDLPPDRNALLAWLVILASIALLMAVTAIGSRRWKAAGYVPEALVPRPPPDSAGPGAP